MAYQESIIVLFEDFTKALLEGTIQSVAIEGSGK